MSDKKREEPMDTDDESSGSGVGFGGTIEKARLKHDRIMPTAKPPAKAKSIRVRNISTDPSTEESEDRRMSISEPSSFSELDDEASGGGDRKMSTETTTEESAEDRRMSNSTFSEIDDEVTSGCSPTKRPNIMICEGLLQVADREYYQSGEGRSSPESDTKAHLESPEESAVLLMENIPKGINPNENFPYEIPQSSEANEKDEGGDDESSGPLPLLTNPARKLFIRETSVKERSKGVSYNEVHSNVSVSVGSLSVQRGIKTKSILRSPNSVTTEKNVKLTSGGTCIERNAPSAGLTDESAASSKSSSYESSESVPSITSSSESFSSLAGITPIEDTPISLPGCVPSPIVKPQALRGSPGGAGDKAWGSESPRKSRGRTEMPRQPLLMAELPTAARRASPSPGRKPRRAPSMPRVQEDDSGRDSD